MLVGDQEPNRRFMHDDRAHRRGPEVLNRMGHDYLARAKRLDPTIEMPD